MTHAKLKLPFRTKVGLLIERLAFKVQGVNIQTWYARLNTIGQEITKIDALLKPFALSPDEPEGDIIKRLIANQPTDAAYYVMPTTASIVMLAETEALDDATVQRWAEYFGRPVKIIHGKFIDNSQIKAV